MAEGDGISPKLIFVLKIDFLLEERRPSTRIVDTNERKNGDAPQKKVREGNTTLSTTKKKKSVINMFRGPEGPQGPIGPRGPTGPAGIGLQGPEGPRGLPGINGRDGVNGAKGADGAPGKDGENGKDGAQGPRGFHGPTGREGPRGPAGSLGPRGLQGEKGERGEKGEMGTIPETPWTLVTFDTYGLGGSTMNPWVAGVTFNESPTDSSRTTGISYLTAPTSPNPNTFVSANRFRQRLVLDQSNIVVYVQNASAVFEVQRLVSSQGSSLATLPDREFVVHPPPTPGGSGALNIAVLLQNAFDPSAHDILILNTWGQSLHVRMTPPGWVVHRFSTVESPANVPAAHPLENVFVSLAQINGDSGLISPDGPKKSIADFLADKTKFGVIDNIRQLNGQSPIAADSSVIQGESLDTKSLTGLLRYPNILRSINIPVIGQRPRTRSANIAGVTFVGPIFTPPIGARRFRYTIQELVPQTSANSQVTLPVGGIGSERLPAGIHKMATFFDAPVLQPGEMFTLLIDYSATANSKGTALVFQSSRSAYFVITDSSGQGVVFQSAIDSSFTSTAIIPNNMVGAGTYQNDVNGNFRFVGEQIPGWFNTDCVIVPGKRIGVQYRRDMGVSTAGSFPSVVIFDATSQSDFGYPASP